MGQHLIPFKGKKHSGAVTQNLLWQDDNVYLMDNHRAALWCWAQQLNLAEEEHNILHIDRHYDALKANLDRELAATPDVRNLSIEDYLAAEYGAGERAPLFRWDNYLSLHIGSPAGQNLKLLRCITHYDGDKPEPLHLMESPAEDLPENLAYWLSRDSNWIVNIDIDYFFCNAPSSNDVGLIPFYSREYFATVCDQLRVAMAIGNVRAVTVCLTPDSYTPGWDACLELSAQIFLAIGREHPEI